MSLLNKILLVLLGLVVLGSAGFIIYTEHRMSARQDAIEQSVIAQKQLADNITRAMADWTTKADLDKFAQENNININAIKDDLAKLNANVTAINISTTSSTGQVATNLTSTSTHPNVGPTTPVPTVDCNGTQIPCPNADPFGYRANTQTLTLNEEFGTTKVPLGDVGFSAVAAAPWSINLLPRQYKSVTVLGTDENQRTLAYNKFTVNVNNKDYDLTVNTSQIQQVYPDPKFTLWNPRLYLGFDGGVNVNSLTGSAGPNLNLQVMSYGKYKTQPDFSILQVGAAYDMVAQKPAAILTPFSYNVGQHLPLMNNLYVGPSIQLNTAGNLSATLGIRVGL